MLRTSSYTIYVDLPTNQNEMLLVHGYMGTYDKVSRQVATYLRSLEVRRPPKPLYGEWTPEPVSEGALHPSEEILVILKRRGYLTEMSVEEEEEFFTRFVELIHKRNLHRMPSYIVMPTYDCNLRCSYCFQDHMRTDAKFNHLLRSITPQSVDLMFGAMREIEDLHGVKGESRHRSIGFFGGEPLLERNRPIIEYITQKAFSCGTANLWAVTNGTDLHVYADLLSPDKISYLQITIDGVPEEHDRRRIYVDGGGSYEKIARNITMALDRGVHVSVRLNLDRNNIGNVPRIAAEFETRGWSEHPGFSAYAAPVRAANDKTEANSTFNTWELDQALSDLRSAIPGVAAIDRPDDAIKNQAQEIFRGTSFTPTLRESFCSAHTRMYIFDPFLDIYACWERTGDPSVRVGNVTADGKVSINAPVNLLWKSRTVASNPVCRRCRYALHCGGGCAVLALGKTGKYHANFCDGYASRFRSSVAEAYLDFAQGVFTETKQARVCDQ